MVGDEDYSEQSIFIQVCSWVVGLSDQLFPLLYLHIRGGKSKSRHSLTLPWSICGIFKMGNSKH